MRHQLRHRHVREWAVHVPEQPHELRERLHQHDERQLELRRLQ
jgi:hypothetical protein